MNHIKSFADFVNESKNKAIKESLKYIYDDKEYTEQELIDHANVMSEYDRTDVAQDEPEIDNIANAIKYLEAADGEEIKIVEEETVKESTGQTVIKETTEDSSPALNIKWDNIIFKLSQQDTVDPTQTNMILIDKHQAAELAKKLQEFLK
jgi:hypothetical protein